MALVERIMGEPFEPDHAKRITTHEFTAWCYESAFGPRTVAQIKAQDALCGGAGGRLADGPDA